MGLYKKTALVILIIIVLAFNVMGYARTQVPGIKSGRDITFFAASDIHYLAKGLTDNGQAFKKFISDGDGKELGFINEIMDAFANDIEKKKPDVLIISGDLTCNGEKQSHMELAARLREIERIGTSVYVIPGNHDILNPYARGFKEDEQYVTDYINDKDFSEIYGDFGYNEAISRDKNTLSYLAAPSEDVWLLMLDTAQYKNNLTLGQPELDGRIPDETLQWIKKCSDLAKSKGARIITVMHHSLINHSEAVNKGFTINNSKDAALVLQQCGIDLALTGHIHLQDIKYLKNDAGTIYDISTACLSIYPQKYGILKYSKRDGIYYTTDSVDVDGWSKGMGIKDETLNNFRDFSKKYFGDRDYSKVVSRLAITDLYTSEDLKLMADTYKTLDLRYTEGLKEVATEEMKNSLGFKLWLSSDEEPLQKSVLRLANSNGEVNNKLYIH